MFCPTHPASPTLLSLENSPAVTMASSLLSTLTGHTPDKELRASGCSLCWNTGPKSHEANFFCSFKSLLRCHLLNETYSLKNCSSVLSPTFLFPSPCFTVFRIYHCIYDANCLAWPDGKVHESMRMDVFVLISTTSLAPARVTSAEQLFNKYLLNEWMESIYTNKQSRMASRLGELSVPDAAFMSWGVSLVLIDRYKLRFRVKLQGPSRLAHRLLSSLLICFASGQRQGH